MKLYFLLCCCGFILGLCLAACDAHSNNDSLPMSTLPSSTSFSPATSVFASEAERQVVEYWFEALREALAYVKSIWERLAAGESLSCSEQPEIPAVETIPDNNSTLSSLRQAAISIQEAADLWLAECQSPRQQLPRQVINEGLLKVRSAQAVLAEIEEQLNR